MFNGFKISFFFFYFFPSFCSGGRGEEGCAENESRVQFVVAKFFAIQLYLALISVCSLDVKSEKALLSCPD